MNADPTKVLVVDDSALYRQSIHNVLRELTEVNVVGTAKNGVEALQKIEQLDPDLLTLDVQMPDMDGIRLLHEIKRRKLRPKAIMVSSFTSEGAEITTEALIQGAFDFILKPSSSDSAANRQQLQESLATKISAFREAFGRKRWSRRPVAIQNRDDVAEASPTPQAACRAVVIGCSTGGPEALKIVLPKLPAELPVPVLVVQHMPAQYTRSLAGRLDDYSPIHVVEAADNTEVVPGTVLIAPGGHQMKVERAEDCFVTRICGDPPENSVRPSVDYLLRSAVEVFDGNVLSVILTGMGRDGLEGCRCLKQGGGYVFAQAQDDCVVYGMPKAVIEDNLADRVLPLGKIAPAIVRHVKRSRRSSA